MAKIRIELNSKGVGALLRSPGVRADLQARADRIATGAGEGHAAYTWRGHDRTRARVTTSTDEADRSEAIDGTLSRAIDLGRG